MKQGTVRSHGIVRPHVSLERFGMHSANTRTTARSQARSRECKVKAAIFVDLATAPCPKPLQAQFDLYEGGLTEI
ncbi:hypothetical protein PIB30_075955 [Stylosanthes scabra]|uniref:Uncharacterized protein n=1 Tax=Stylosanthes scabra TaxID=79078 RepID=A0ABU6SQ99_9FABA|nr:hypothetical protein [Stylosanthes scabra]